MAVEKKPLSFLHKLDPILSDIKFVNDPLLLLLMFFDTAFSLLKKLNAYNEARLSAIICRIKRSTI